MSEGTGIDLAELAQERAELLPERMTLDIFDNGFLFTPINIAIHSPWSNHAAITPAVEANLFNVNGATVVSMADSSNFLYQW